MKIMLIGEHWHTIDPKNRIMIPTKLRNELGSPFMLTKGLDHCLYAFPMAAWEQFQETLAQLPGNRNEARRYKRFFLAGASQVEMDKQGRALIPIHLVEFGNLVNEVVTIGMQDKLEIWSRESWDQYQNEELDMDELAERMADLGL